MSFITYQSKSLHSNDPSLGGKMIFEKGEDWGNENIYPYIGEEPSLPWNSSANCSQVGASLLQCPHHGAKSWIKYQKIKWKLTFK